MMLNAPLKTCSVIAYVDEEKKPEESLAKEVLYEQMWDEYIAWCKRQENSAHE